MKVLRVKAVPRNALWTNGKRMYRGQKCVGTYKKFRNKRVFILEDAAKGAIHRFDSHEAAKALGWKKVDQYVSVSK